jgi:hypothetical protein
MAPFPAHNSGAPHYGVHPGQSAYGVPRQPGPRAPGQDIPYYYTDIRPAPLTSFPAPTTTSRDVRANTRRKRTHRSSSTQRQRLHGLQMSLQDALAARSPASHRRPLEQVWFVPDPPTWGAPRAVQSETPQAIERSHNYPPLPWSSAHGRWQNVEPRVPHVGLTSSPDSGRFGSAGAASDQVLPTPPPTPRIPRLRTPDIKPVDECELFCGCCAAIGEVVDSRWKTEMKCKSRCRLGSRS